MWRLEETESNSVVFTAQTADTQLRESQADEAYTSFGRRLDDANNTETSLVLASAVASSDGGNGSASSSGFLPFFFEIWDGLEVIGRKNACWVSYVCVYVGY